MKLMFKLKFIDKYKLVNQLMFVSLVIVSLLIVSCAPAAPADKICQSDLDCVPAVCCHAADAVNKENAPDCSGKLCTLECAPGTIDCGQGSVACVEGACQAIMRESLI